MSLLIESMDENLTESRTAYNEATKEKEYFIEGIFLQSEVVNKNRRIYPREVMQREADKYNEVYINNNRGMGELEHPGIDRDNAINLRYVSHKIELLENRGNNWFGRARIAHKQGMGALVANLIECGITLGTSSRATGSVKTNTNGISVVQNDFRLITPSDIVADPSAPDAVLTSLMEKTWIYENNILEEQQLDVLSSNVNTLYKVSVLDNQKLEKAFQSILRTIGE